MTSDSRTSVLFVCMGNICRSPLAECVFLHQLNRRGVADRFRVDSAGTGGWHRGHPPDERMQRVAKANGITVHGAARQVRTADFTEFDYILCMDEDNRENLLKFGAPPEKVSLLLDHHPDDSIAEVPDPYYGGMDGFELVFKLVDAACESLIDQLLAEDGAHRS